MRKNSLPVLAMALLAVSGCKGIGSGKHTYPKSREEQAAERVGKLTGDGIVLFGGKKNRGDGFDSINVNSFLWRATLDTVYFMPLISADPFGGTILTDWYQASPSAKERFKVNVLIVGTELRSDAVRVSAFKQVRGANGSWQDAAVPDGFALDIETKIINRAREIRAGNI
jgi:hypothetical protein